MKLFNTIICSIMLVAVSNGCSNNNASGVNAKGEYPEEYARGRNDLTMMLQECDTENKLRDELLDIRSREYLIRTQKGDEPADAYLQGFKDALKESGDTLYATLFE